MRTIEVSRFDKPAEKSSNSTAVEVSEIDANWLKGISPTKEQIDKYHIKIKGPIMTCENPSPQEENDF